MPGAHAIERYLVEEGIERTINAHFKDRKEWCVTLRIHYICLCYHVIYFAQVYIFSNGPVLFFNGTYICRMRCFAKR